MKFFATPAGLAGLGVVLAAAARCSLFSFSAHHDARGEVFLHTAELLSASRIWTWCILLSAQISVRADDTERIHRPNLTPGGEGTQVMDSPCDDNARLLFLSSKAVTTGVSSAPVASGQTPPSYVVRAGLGSPSQQLLLTLERRQGGDVHGRRGDYALELTPAMATLALRAWD